MRDYRRDLHTLMCMIPHSVNVAPTLLPAHDNLRHSYAQARQQYERLVSMEAHRLQRLHGFSWEAVADGAPSTYAELQAEYNECRLTGKPFRVWSGGSDKTVFSAPAINHAFRFVHDLGHVMDGCDLTEQGEVDVITAFVWRVFSQAGFLAALLAACDLLGQLYYGTNNHGAFVDYQESFVSALFFMLLRSHHEDTLHGYRR